MPKGKIDELIDAYRMAKSKANVQAEKILCTLKLTLQKNEKVTKVVRDAFLKEIDEYYRLKAECEKAISSI